MVVNVQPLQNVSPIPVLDYYGLLFLPVKI